MLDVDLIQALAVRSRAPPPPPAEAVQGEKTGIIAKVMEEAGQGSGQERDCEHGATPLELVGEKQLVWGPGGRSGE